MASFKDALLSDFWGRCLIRLFRLLLLTTRLPHISGKIRVYPFIAICRYDCPTSVTDCPNLILETSEQGLNVQAYLQVASILSFTLTGLWGCSMQFCMITYICIFLYPPCSYLRQGFILWSTPPLLVLDSVASVFQCNILARFWKPKWVWLEYCELSLVPFMQF